MATSMVRVQTRLSLLNSTRCRGGEVPARGVQILQAHGKDFVCGLEADAGLTAHVRQVHQLRQALAGALPRGLMIAVKAWLMAGTEMGVAAERRANTCS